MNKKCGQGFTLTELMVTVAIVGIIATMAAPSFVDLIARTRLKTAAENIHADLQYAKMQSIKQNTNIHLDFTKTSNTDWCYGISNKTACDCTKGIADADSCTITENGAAMLKVTSNTDVNNMQLTTAEAKFSFNSIRSTVNANGVTLSNGTNMVRVKASGLAKISYCVPVGESLWGGYKSC